MGQRILLTGGTGFIGKALLGVLAESGSEVHLITRESDGSQIRFRSGGARIEQHQIDLMSPASWESSVRAIQATHLVHLAWCTDQGANLESKQNSDWVTASMRLIDAFVSGGGRRLVAAGTCAEYDWSGDLDFIREGDRLDPATLYGRCKVELHTRLQRAFPSLSHAWCRIFVPYGPNDHQRRVLNYVISNLLRGEVANCSEGRQVLDFIHIRDVATIFARLIESSLEGSVNVGTGLGHSVREVVAIAAREIDREDLVRFGTRSTGAINARLVADTRRLREELLFYPQIPIERGIAETIRWYRDVLDAGAPKG